MPTGSIAAKDNLNDLLPSKWIVHSAFHTTAIIAILNIAIKLAVALLVLISIVADGSDSGGCTAVFDSPPIIRKLVDTRWAFSLESSG